MIQPLLTEKSQASIRLSNTDTASSRGARA